MIDYLILGGIVLIIILLVVIIFKSVNESNITERLGRLENTTIKELGEFKVNLIQNMNDNFDLVNERMEYKLNLMNDKVNSRLDDNFSKTNKTFTSILERLSRIDEAQKKIDNLSSDIVSLQSILTDKKSRGIFGEINLNHIMANIFGEKNDRIYQMQYHFGTFRNYCY